MIGQMGNCFPWKNKRKSLSLLMLGLDNAGKTTAVKCIQGDTLDVAPTVGFSEANAKFGDYDLRIMDVGGGRSIRGVWKHYLAEAHGVIFVVDASDKDRTEEGKEALANVLEHQFVAGKPILLLANKQDVSGAMNEADICDALDLQDVVNRNRCPCKVELCAAIKSKPKKMDPSLQQGLGWLVRNISSNFESITSRMEGDMMKQDEERKKEAEERAERVRIKREEREKREAEEKRKEEGKTNDESAETGDDNAVNKHDSSETDVKTPIHESIVTSSRSVRSGLGDEILDEDDDVNIPGAVISHDVIKGITNHEDSCTESQQRSRTSSGRNTPLENHESESQDTAIVTDNGDDNGDVKSKKKKKKTKKSNRVNPMDTLPPLSAGGMGQLKPLKLAPLSMDGKPNGDAATFDLQPLPPLKRPNADSEEDIVV
ncbi:uncharacterized protein LOC100178782 [Ciona intestinalis]